jgi:hypothetical protein
MLYVLVVLAVWFAGTAVYVFCRALNDAFNPSKIASDEARYRRNAEQAKLLRSHR